MGLMFDPGFGKYANILSVNVEYIYADIAKFKNFGQKKTQFKMYYPKIQNLVNNNVAFCLGCILWAVYIKSLGSQEIINNPCLGEVYDENEAVEELDFSKDYFEQLKKDVKYYLGQNYTYDPKFLNILNAYREFLILNEAFVNTKSTDDLKLPVNLKPVADLNVIKEKIDSVVQSGKLTDLFELYGTIL